MAAPSREPNFVPAAAIFLPRGVESIIEYNGLVMNDRRRADRIVITDIGGLDDPDVRDARENNPDRDGETPLDPLYGGRTITLKGYVQAGNLNKMRELFSRVKDAFDELIERPLRFRWLDWKETFQDSQALVDYEYETGSGLSIALDGSGLAPTMGLKRIVLTPDRYQYGDVEMTAYVSQSSWGTQGVRFVLARVNASQRLVVGADNGYLYVRKVVGGVSTDLYVVAPTIPTPPGTAAPFYIRVRKEGNVVTTRVFYSGWENTTTDLPYNETVYTLAGANATMFGAGVVGDVGMEWSPAATTDRIPLFDVAALNPGDAQINVRKVGKIESPENQSTNNFKREFLITLRASDPRFVSRMISSVTVTPSSFDLTFSAGGSLTFSAAGILYFGALLPTAIVNLGRSPASPIVRFYGPMTNPAIRHSVTNKVVGINGVIGAGDYYEFDCFRRTVVDASGVDRYNVITDDTDWIDLSRGANDLILGASSVSGGYLVFYYRHSSR